MGIRLFFDKTPFWHDGIEVLLTFEHADKRWIGNLFAPMFTGEKGKLRIEFDEYKAEGTRLSPTFNLSYEHAQELMDELWRFGVRPTNNVGTAGHLQAIQLHLDDMREQQKELLSVILANKYKVYDVREGYE